MKMFNKILFATLIMFAIPTMAANPMITITNGVVTHISFTLVMSRAIGQETIAMVTIPGFVSAAQCAAQAKLITSRNSVNSIQYDEAFCVAVVSADTK